MFSFRKFRTLYTNKQYEVLLSEGRSSNGSSAVGRRHIEVITSEMKVLMFCMASTCRKRDVCSHVALFVEREVSLVCNRKQVSFGEFVRGHRDLYFLAYVCLLIERPLGQFISANISCYFYLAYLSKRWAVRNPESFN